MFRRELETRQYRQQLWAAGVFGTAILTAAALSEAACSKETATITRQDYVDCVREPHGSASILIDTTTHDNELVGNAFVRRDGTLSWREQMELQTAGDGTVALTEGGFGPIDTYDNIAHGHGWGFFNDHTHSTLTSSTSEFGPNGTEPLPVGQLIFTFHCFGEPPPERSFPGSSFSPTPWTTPA
ncbi:MAG TPA: hypothetical protein VJP80_04495 [Candidatus Saccharimonadales bacterium]|nr:hypothetical protein [Candidatus Saccharimonadales bacterium]